MRVPAYAVIEPGVTYRQLNRHLKEHGDRLWCDCTDGASRWKRFGKPALDRGIGLGPYSDHFASLCGLEVVLPSGDCVRTGGGPSGGSQTWHTYKWGIGPYLEGLFSQSNYGVVTQAGVWLMPEPQALSVSLEIADDAGLLPVVDIVSRLMKQGVMQGAPRIINDVTMLHVLTQVRNEFPDYKRRLSEEDRARLRKKYSLPRWRLGGALCGTVEQVWANRKAINRELSRYAKIRFLSDRGAKDARRFMEWAGGKGKNSLRYRASDFAARRVLGKPFDVLDAALEGHEIFKGVPSELFVKHAYFKASAPRPGGVADPLKDRCGLIWFAPILPFTSAHVENIYRIVEPLFEKYDCDSYRALLVRNERTLIALMCLRYRKDVPGDEQRIFELYTELGKVAAAAGYQWYRSAVTGMSGIYAHSPILQNLVDRIKSCLDPNGVISPGSYGIRGVAAE